MTATQTPSGVAKLGRKPKPVDMSTLSGVLAAKIRELRESKGLSIEEFAVLISEHNYTGS